MSSIPDFASVPRPAVTAAPSGADLDAWRTPEGIDVPASLAADTNTDLAFPGTFPGLAPFVRGPYPTMYVNQPWTIRQYAGFSTAEDPTPSTGATLRPARRVCRSPSISPPTAAMTPTIRG